MCIGHANPVVGAAVKARIDEGTHFAAPTDGSIAVAAELKRRFGLPQWRFTNSGTESTMDAVHLARGATGRDMILKIEGSYHGHHDTVMVSVYPPLEALGARDEPVSVPYGGGIPTAFTELTRAVPFNDADALEGALKKIGDQVAGLIMEPAMMNINIIPPRPGYLERVRELTSRVRDQADLRRGQDRGDDLPRRRHRPLRRDAGHDHPRQGQLRRLPRRLDRDERGAGGDRRRRHRQPVRHLQRQPAGDGGGRGDPDPGPHRRRLRALRSDQPAPARRLPADHRRPTACPPTPRASAPRAASSSRAERLYEYRDYLTKVDDELSRLAWLYHMNHGIFMTPGTEEEWTLSIAHSDEDLQRYLDAFEAFAGDVTSG